MTPPKKDPRGDETHAGEITVQQDSTRASAKVNSLVNDPIGRVLAKLPGARRSGNGWIARCPAHDDKTPSLSVSVGDDGRVLLKCHAGCTFDKIVEALDLQPADLFPQAQRSPRRNGKQQSRIVEVYTYQDENGATLLEVVRSEPKAFSQRRPDGNGGYIPNLNGVRRILYRLPELLQSESASWVFIVEGEKDVECLRGEGLVATCNPGGAGKWSAIDDKPLHGRGVCIIPDNDDVGRKHASDIAKNLQGNAADVRIVELPGLPPKGDVSDWLQTHSIGELLQLVDNAPQYMPESVASAQPSWQPFPVNVLPELVRSFVVEGANAMVCDPAYIALPVLAVLASAIGTTRRILLKKVWTEPSVIWTAIVGFSGTGKSPALDCALAPLKRLQTQRFREHQKAIENHLRDNLQYEADLAQWKHKKQDNRGDPPQKTKEPSEVRYLVSDTTIEAIAPILLVNPRGVLVGRDELAAWLGSFQRYRAKGVGGDSAQWLEMHRAGQVLIDRKTSIPRRIYVPSAAVSIAGSIQPEILQRSLGREHFEDGLAARLLLAMPPRKCKQWSEADVSQQTVDQFGVMIEALLRLEHRTDLQGNPAPIDVLLDPEAREVWIEFFNEHAQKQAVVQNGDLAAAFSKLEGYAARFALLFHLVRKASVPDFVCNEITADDVRAGVELARWFCNETERIYKVFSDSAKPENDLLGLIRNNGGSVTVRELQRRPRQFRGSSESVRARLDELVEAGIGAWEHPAPDKLGGRPSEVFRMNNDRNGGDKTQALEAESEVLSLSPVSPDVDNVVGSHVEQASPPLNYNVDPVNQESRTPFELPCIPNPLGPRPAGVSQQGWLIKLKDCLGRTNDPEQRRMILESIRAEEVGSDDPTG